MRTFTLILLATIAAIVSTSVSAYAVTYSRLVVFNTTLSSGNIYVFKIPIVVINGYSTVYMSSASDCSLPLPTMAFIGSSYALIMFKPLVSSSRFYLCYGDSIYYQPQLFAYAKTNVLTVSASSTPESTSGSINNWYYSDVSGSVDIYDFGEMVHVYDANVTVYVPSGYTLTFTLCGNSYTVSGGWSTIRGGGCDNTSLMLYVSGTGYFYVSTYSIDYYPYVYNSTNVTVSGANTWLIHVVGKDWWASSGTCNTTSTTAADIYMAYTPAGGVAWTASGGIDVAGVSGYNATVYAWIYNWTGVNTVSYEIDYVNTTLANVTLISAATIVSSTTGSTTGNASSVSVTLDVSEPIYNTAATMLEIAATAAAVAVIAMFNKWRAMKMMALTTIAASMYIASTIMYIEAGNPTGAKSSIILMLAMISIDVAAMLYKEIPRII